MNGWLAAFSTGEVESRTPRLRQRHLMNINTPWSATTLVSHSFLLVSSHQFDIRLQQIDSRHGPPQTLRALARLTLGQHPTGLDWAAQGKQSCTSPPSHRLIA